MCAGGTTRVGYPEPTNGSGVSLARHNGGMSQPTPPTPAVPYGPPASGSGEVTPAVATIGLSRSGVAGTAGKWAIRLLLPLLIRALFRAIFR